MTIRVDDRTLEQHVHLTSLIAATDSFLSGWGMAEKGASYCAWACRPEHEAKVLAWVESRGDMKRVRLVGESWPLRARAAHVHVYAVEEDHPALA